MSLTRMSLSAGFMIVAIVLLRAIAIHRLNKSVFLGLWLVSWLRLMIPFTVESPLSAMPQMPDAAGAVLRRNLVLTPQAGAPVWPVIWAIGAGLCAAYFLWAYFRVKVRLSRAATMPHPEAEQWLGAHPIRRAVTVKRCARLAAPLTYGVLRPTILLPMERSEERLPFILAHELAHIRRFDALIKPLLVLAACVHWFNPLVWIMFVLANRDLELSCDECVVRALGEQTKSAYALALIGMEEARSGFAPMYSHFSKNAIEERIVAIMKIRKRTAFAVVIGLVLVIAVSVAFATSPAKPRGGAEYAPTVSREELFAPYCALGAQYRANEDRLYLDGQMIGVLVDEQAAFAYSVPEGQVFLRAVYEGGALTGLEPIDQAQAREAVKGIGGAVSTQPVAGGAESARGIPLDKQKEDFEALKASKDELINGGVMTEAEFDQMVRETEEFIRAQA